MPACCTFDNFPHSWWNPHIEARTVYLQSCSTVEYQYVLVAGPGRLEVDRGGDAPLQPYLSSASLSTSSSGRGFQLRARWMKGKNFSPSPLSSGNTESWGNGTKELGKIRWPWELAVISKAGWSEHSKIPLAQLLEFESSWKFVTQMWEDKSLLWCYSQLTI